MGIKRESTIVYRSFMEASDNMESAEDYRTFMQIALHYAFDGELPKETKGYCYNMFLLIKPLIDANNKKHDIAVENGSKGGRPKKSTGKTEDIKQEEPPPQIKASYGKYNNVWLSTEELEELKQKYNTNIVTDYIERVGNYKERKGVTYNSDYLTIIKWITEDKDKTKTKVSENSFNKFEQHEYNYDELEKQLLSN